MCRKFSFFVSLILVLCLFGNAWGLVWGDKDIGNPGIAGSSSEAAGTWTILGSGHDIWGNADGIHYVYRPLSGDGSLQVNLQSMDLTSGWAKVGPAIREDLGAGSKHAMTAMTGSYGIQFVWRELTDQGSAGVTRGGETWPSILRITRIGDEMIGEFGEEVPFPPFFQWYEVARTNISMNTDVTIGMAVCATNQGALNTAVLDGVVLTAPPYENPWDLSPADGSTGMPLTTTLSWMPGDSATSHDVLFGTDPAALALVATKALGDESYAPTLEESVTYYWQIVEQPLGQASAIMSFKTKREIGAGLIDRCIWEGIGGVSIPDLTGNPAYPDSPTWCDTLTSMDSGDFADNYGGRMQGLLVPETSGDYTFWIAADDDCELWLSSSTKACEAVKIAYWYGWTGRYAYDWHPEQMSASIPLVAGESYLIRALWKEGGGGDHCSVAWEGPDAPSRTEISGYYVIPGYVEAEAGILSPADGATVTVQEAAAVSFAPGATAVSHNVYLGTDPAALSLVATVAMPDTTAALPGIAVDTTYYLMVEADDGTNTYPGCPTSFSTAEWVSLDIGGSWGGSATQSGDCWTIVANGSDIWGNADSFHFVYITPTFTRDEGTVIANVSSLVTANWWTKAGVMIRETTAGNSKNAAMLTTPSDGQNMATFQRRADTGGGSASIYPGGGGSPEWLKLTRKGNSFKGSHSEDGVNWTYLGEHIVNMNSFVRVGLAVTSHNTGALTTAEICDLTITTPDPRQAWGLEPANGATGINIHATLSWIAGEGATEHQVYFSEDEEAVVNRTVAPVILPAETTELAVGPLDLTKVYYWCVDEVVNPVIPGEVVSFTAENYRVIDDFEAYDVEPEALPVQQLIPGEILLEAVPPPDQAWVEPQTIVLVEAVAPDESCLVSRWDFEGDFTDSAGSNDGTPNGDATIVADATRGDVLSLDGDGDYVDCGNPADLDFGTGNWTVSVWVNTTVTGKPKGVPYAKGGDGGGGKRYTLGVGESKSDRVTLTVDDNSDKKQSHSSTHVTDGTWHNVIGVRNGDRIYIYTDGKLEDNDGLPSGFDLSGTSQANAYIGAIWNQGSSVIEKFYTGMIDDVRVYSCAMTPGNIRYLAGAGDLTVDKPGYYGPLIAHYTFDEGSGDTAADSSGNGLDGAISGAVYTTATVDGSASCLDFNGLGDNVFNGLAGPYLNNLFELSISMWIQSDEIASDKGFFMGSASGSDRHGMRYDSKGGSADPDGNDVIKYGVRTLEGNEEDESSQFVQTTEWQHVVMTWQSGVGMTLWINGSKDVPTFDGGAKGSVTDGYNRLWVGKGSKDMDDDEGWDGRIDDVRVYGLALTEGEVRYLAGVGNIALPDWYSPLIAHYEFEGSADDSSGNELHGELRDDAHILYDDLIGSQVVDLDGEGDDHVNCGNSNLFDTLDDQMTIATWIRIRDFGGWWTKLLSNGNTSSWRFERMQGSGAVSIPFDGTNPNGRRIGDISIDDGQWHHIAAVLNSPEGYSALYVDGIVDDYGSAGGNCNTNDNEIRIGDHQAWHDRTNGWFDDVRIYNEALTLGQVRNLANYMPPNPLSATWSGRAAAAPALEYLAPAHEGAQCMRVEYTGSGAVTRLEPFGDGAHPHGWNGDFSLGQAEALSLWFKGDPDNAPGTLFAQLTTVVPSGHTQRVLYNGDPEDLLMPDWQEWNISLLELSTGKPADPIDELGLPITKIKDVGVGIIGAGGGVVYFDDLRLQPVRCIPEYGPAADLDDDCDVDEADFRILIGDWAWQSNPGVPGVRYEYYEDYYDGLNDFDVRAQMPTRVGVKANFDISGHRGDGFAYRFTAKVAAPVDGYYTFYTSSDDGSKLYINGTQVVDNDGFHGMQWREGTKYLTAGLHDIMVTMFEWGGGEGLLTEVEGPGIPRMPIPNEVLYLPDAPDADLNGDGIVNFLDYADILNSYVDEVLWPPPYLCLE